MVELNCELMIATQPENEVVRCRAIINGKPDYIDLPVKILREKKKNRSGNYAKFL